MDFLYRLKDAFNTAFIGGVVIAALGAGAVYTYGLPDKDNAEACLKDMGCKVVEYKGHPAFGGSGLFADKFTIETAKGEKKDVVVSHGLTTPMTIAFTR